MKVTIFRYSGRLLVHMSARWEGEATSPGVRLFPVGNLPAKLLDWSRAALRNYAAGMRFSTYPALAVSA